MALSMTNQLKSHFGELSNTLFFEYISVAEMADYFTEQHTDCSRKLLSGTEQAQTKAVGAKESCLKEKLKKQIDFSQLRSGGEKALPLKIDTRPDIKEIAVIGISGRYPMADNVAQYWRNLKQGRDCTTPIPRERWDHRLYFDPEKPNPGKSYAQSGGFINDVDKFDPLFFDISPKEAETIDPQERLFLEIAWEVLEDAGYTRETLIREYNRKIGVFVGCMYQHYPWLARDCKYDGIVNPNSYWSIANRVSYILDSQGPSIAVDSACSSSLSAINLACESIKKGECQMALAGGVNLNLHPDKFIILSQNQLLASGGKCRALGNGDGYLPGEGVGAVLLKPLPLAEKDRDHIYAVMKGGMMNHCGKTSGCMVPSPKAQTDLMVQVFDSAGVHPEAVNYMEIAANGSSLGDAIEITGLKKAFKQYTDKKHFCSIGTVKSNIGHLEAASGISQLTKLICQIRHKTLVPTINTEPLNENIDLAESPFFIQKEVMNWEKPEIKNNGVKKTYKRTAAISSFGAGGSNTTILVQEYEDRRQVPADPAPDLVIVPLSAKTDRRLYEYVVKLSNFLEKQNGSVSLENQNNPVDLRNLAYTLQTGREPMETRLALVVNSLEELKIKLQEIGADPFCNIDGVFRSYGMKNSENRASVSATLPDGSDIKNKIKNGEFDKIARAWVEGQNIDWRLLPQNADAYKISLPAYAFERRRCWITPHGKPLGPPGQVTVTEGISNEKSKNAPPIAPTPEAAPSTEDQIATYIQNELIAFFGLTPDDFKPDTPIDRFGFDSIKAMNFRYRLEKGLGVSIPMTAIGRSRTLDQLVDNLAKAVKIENGTTDDTKIPKLVEMFLLDRTDLSSTSDHDLDALYKELSRNSNRFNKMAAELTQ
jgi:polyketide synthase PksN